MQPRPYLREAQGRDCCGGAGHSGPCVPAVLIEGEWRVSPGSGRLRHPPGNFSKFERKKSLNVLTFTFIIPFVSGMIHYAGDVQGD